MSRELRRGEAVSLFQSAECSRFHDPHIFAGIPAVKIDPFHSAGKITDEVTHLPVGVCNEIKPVDPWNRMEVKPKLRFGGITEVSAGAAMPLCVPERFVPLHTAESGARSAFHRIAGKAVPGGGVKMLFHSIAVGTGSAAVQL